MKLYIPRTTYQKIMYWVNKTNKEVGGMATVKYNKEQDYFWVTEAFLLEQEVSGAATDLDASALGKLELEVLGSDLGELNLWWHSHVMMNCFWSTTDKDTITKYGGNGYMLATVFNQKNEMRSALAYSSATPYGSNRTEFLDNIETIIYDSIPEELTKQWDTEYTAKVKEYVPTVRSGSTRVPKAGEFQYYDKDYEYTYDYHCSPYTAKNIINIINKEVKLDEEYKRKVDTIYTTNLAAADEYTLKSDILEASLLLMDVGAYSEQVYLLSRKQQNKLIKILDEREKFYNDGKHTY